MADLIYMTKTAWQNLLSSIKTKAGYVGTLTASQAKTAVDNIQTGGGGAPDHYISFEYNSNNLPASAVVHGIKRIQERQFKGMTALTDVQIDSATTSIGTEVFLSCRGLTKLKFPGVINDSISSAAFRSCSGLTEVDLNTGQYASIGTNVFAGCSSLSTLIIRGPYLIPATASTAFTSTPLEAGTGTVYVPQALISSYQTAANWSALYAAGTQFVALEGSIYE